MEIIPLDLEDFNECLLWDNFVSQYPEIGHHHRTEYLKAILNVYNHANLSLICFQNGVVTGVLPLVGISSKIFGNKVSSIPYYNYGGVLSEDKDVEEALYSYAENLTKELNYDTLQIRALSPLHDNLKELGWFEQRHKVNMVLTLPDDMKKIGSGNAKKRAKLRSQSKLAERKASELNVELKQCFGGSELLDDFYSVFSEHMRDLGTPVFGRDFFESVIKEIPSRISIVYWNKKPVACGWVFEHGKERNSIMWASTLRSVNKFSINAYMYHGILSDCVDRGVSIFDFGRSTIDTGTYKFKEQWGALPVQCHWHEWNKEGLEPSDSSPKDGKFGLIVKVWMKLPLFVTNLVGPHLIKQTAG